MFSLGELIINENMIDEEVSALQVEGWRNDDDLVPVVVSCFDEKLVALYRNNGQVELEDGAELSEYDISEYVPLEAAAEKLDWSGILKLYDPDSAGVAGFATFKGFYRIIKTPLDDVMTISEAAEKFGVDVSTLRRNFANEWKGFADGIDIRKSASTWLVTREAMEEAYGEGGVIKYRIDFGSYDENQNFDWDEIRKEMLDVDDPRKMAHVDLSEVTFDSKKEAEQMLGQIQDYVDGSVVQVVEVE